MALPTVNTIADGTAVKCPGDKIFPYIQENVDEIITVEDERADRSVPGYGREPQDDRGEFRTSDCSSPEASGCKEEKDRFRIKRRQYGCDHHGFYRPARTDPERPCIYRICSYFLINQVSWQRYPPCLQSRRATSSSWSTTSLSASTGALLWSCVSPSRHMERITRM